MLGLFPSDVVSAKEEKLDKFRSPDFSRLGYIVLSILMLTLD